MALQRPHAAMARSAEPIGGDASFEERRAASEHKLARLAVARSAPPWFVSLTNRHKKGAYKEGLTMAWRHLLLLSALDSTLAAQAGACRGLKGGPARAKSLTSNQRQEIAKKGTAARWGKS